METRFFHFFLKVIALCLMSTSMLSAQEASVLDTKYEAKKYKSPDIEVDDFEILANFGFLSIEDFGVSNSAIFSLNYHVNELYFVQASLVTAEASETSFEVLTGNPTLLTDAQRDYESYNISLGYNLFPGEGFFSKEHTFSTDYYVIAGIGSTDFAGDEHFTYNYGAGFRAAISSNFTIYSEFRNYVFDIDVFGTNKSSNNLSISLGIGFVF